MREVRNSQLSAAIAKRLKQWTRRGIMVRTVWRGRWAGMENHCKALMLTALFFDDGNGVRAMHAAAA
jgi:hypothetical protein